MTTQRRLGQNGQDKNFTKTSENVDTPKTDYNRWRLEDDDGRQTWHYLQSDRELKEWPQTTADKYHLGLDTVSDKKLSPPTIGHILMVARRFRVSPRQRRPSKPPKTDYSSSPSSSWNPAIGRVNTAVPCSYCQA